jgi:Secretion system C-terminal sorting domain
MYIMRIKFILFVLLGSALTSFAQVSNNLTANNVVATFTNNGLFFNNGTVGGFEPIVNGVKQASLLEEAGLWISGLDAGGNLRMSIAFQGKSDFSSGTLDPVTGAPSGFLKNKIWKVTREEIEQHKADYADNGIIDNPIPAIFAWPAKGNGSFEVFNNGLQLPNTPQALAPFFDADWTGTYDPSNGDYPAIEIRYCGPVEGAKEICWYVINDADVPGNPATNGGRLRVEIQVTAWAYECSAENAPLGNSIFTSLKVINRGSIALNQVRFGLYNDFSIGGENDDFVGFDPLRNLNFAYNGGNNDALYGINAPSMGVDLLTAPRKPVVLPDGKDSIVETNVNYFVPFNPLLTYTKEGILNMMQGLNADGSSLPNNGLPYSGNPNNTNEPSEISAGNTPGNRATITTFEPFELKLGSQNQILFSHFFARKADYSSLKNQSLIYELSNGVQHFYDNCFESDPSFDPCASVSVAAPEVAAIDDDIISFPNPVQEIWFLESKNASIMGVSLTDIQGKLVFQQKGLPSNTLALHLSTLPSGVYTAQVRTDNGAVAMRKLVVAPK